MSKRQTMATWAGAGLVVALGLYAAKTKQLPPFRVNQSATSTSTPSQDFLTVAVLDTGLEPKLAEQTAQVEFLPGYNFFLRTNDTRDSNSHGTEVTRLVIEAYAQRNSRVPLKILPLKIVENEAGLTPNILTDAITYALDHGSDVIQIAFGMRQDSPELRESVQKATARGVVVVTAAGHGIANPYRPESLAEVFPQAYPEVIVVGATRDAQRADALSNFGPEIDTILWEKENPKARYGSSYASAKMSGWLAAMMARHRDRGSQVKALELKQKLRECSRAKQAYLPPIFQEAECLRLFQNLL